MNAEKIKELAVRLKLRTVACSQAARLRWVALGRKRKILLVGMLFILIPFAYIASRVIADRRAAQPEPASFSVVPPELTDFQENGSPKGVSVNFDVSACRIDLLSKDVSRFISVSPEIPGGWSWTEDNNLVFVPLKEWLPGTEYRVRMGKEMFAPHVRLKSYSFDFKTPPFGVKLEDSEFYQDPRIPDLKKIVATTVFTHPVDAASFESRVSMKLFRGKGEESRGVPLSISVTYNKSMTKAFIHSSPVKVTDEDGQAVVAVQEGVLSILRGKPLEKKAEATVDVPSIYNMFRVHNADIILLRDKNYSPEPVLVLEFSNRVTEEEIQKNLEVYELPADFPALDGSMRIVRNFNWRGVRISQREIDLSRKLMLQPVPTENEYSEVHSFRLNVPEGRYIFVRLHGGTISYGGYRLHESYEGTERVPEFPRELSIMQNGSVLSLSGDKRLPIITRGLSVIKGDIWRVEPGQINHVISQSEGKFSNPQFNYNFGPENIAQKTEFTRTFPYGQPGKTNYMSLDLGALLPRNGDGQLYGLFFVRLRSDEYGMYDSRMVMVTDLGLIAKKNRDGSNVVFVQSLRSGSPVQGARVLVLGKNGVPLVSRATDANGRVDLPTLDSFVRERQPVAYVAALGNDLAFMPFSWSDRELSYSRFDVGGAEESGTPGELSAYVFSDRGIYRPGDGLHAAFIVKSADWKSSLGGVPLEIVVTDSRGLEIYKRRSLMASSGFGELSLALDSNAPTGSYDISVFITKDGRRSSLLGSTHVKVEEFEPDRMKISARFSKDNAAGWINPKDLSVSVSVQNLYGTPAADRNVRAKVIFQPMPFSFPAYRDYFFSAPRDEQSGFQEDLPERTTDSNGAATYDITTDRFEHAGYLVRFMADAFEKEGGRSVGAEASAFVSDLKYIVGYKPDGSLEFVNKGADRSVRLLAVDSSLVPTEVRNLETRLSEQSYVSSLVKNENNTYAYASVLKEVPVSRQDIVLPSAGLKLPLETSSPGDFKLRVLDKSTGAELCAVPYSVAGHGNLSRSLEKSAELQLKLEKEDYAPGESISMQIKAPYSGYGLITIERDKIYAAKWFKTSGSATTESISLPPVVEGNAYVSVAFLRAADSPEIFMSPLSYAAVPFSVSRERRTNVITLDAPSLARPGEPLRVGYKTAKPAKIIVYAVDEGILQVAAYKMPDPLSFFLRKRELSVRTHQILDLLLPEFRLLGLNAAPGGDKDWGAIGKNLNPFKRRRDKPVVFWSGIIDSGPDRRVLEVPVPGYFNGSLKIMAVAVSQDCMGTAQQQVTVRGPFVLSPNAPFSVSPGDEFEFSAGVANMLGASGAADKLHAELKVSGPLQVLDGQAREFGVPRMEDGSVKFRVKARDGLGAAELSLTVSAGTASVTSVSGVSVRPASLYRTFMQSGSLKSGSKELAVGRPLYPDYRVLTVSASQLPLAAAAGARVYLDNYPFACTEQLVSKAFPPLLLGSIAEFGYGDSSAVKTRLDEAIRVIRARQSADGGVGLWGATSEPSSFASLYAMHFMTEAVERGFDSDRDIVSRGLPYLKVILRRTPENMYEARECAYALYLLTRNGNVLAGDLESLRRRLDSGASSAFKGWESDLTGIFLAASYSLLQQRTEAERLIAKASIGGYVSAGEYVYSGQVKDALLLYVLSRHFPERLEKLSAQALNSVSDAISGNPNSIICATSLLGLEAYAQTVRTAKPLAVAVSARDQGGAWRPVTLPPGARYPKADFPDSAVRLKLEDSSGLNIFYQAVEAGFERTLPKKAESRWVEVFRNYLDESGKEVSELALGAQAEVVVRLRTTGGPPLRNLALVDILPGGFEVVPNEAPARANPAHKQTLRDCGEDGCDGSGEEGEGGPAQSDGGYSNAEADFVDYREDRVIIYTSASSEILEYRYKIQAINRGVFLAPPLYAVSMYDSKVYANSAPGMITVK
ncbi:MAG: alpha-2-macroglobulin [Elusimicrobia bacterium]|nr:alpha-2-macroglobulin [Elusimicrobiota bacterium]